MRAELCGFSLAVGPDDACYVPLAHRQGGNGDGGLFAGERVADQIDADVALNALRPLLADPGVLKVPQHLKYDWLIFVRNGIAITPAADTMLMSYALDAAQ